MLPSLVQTAHTIRDERNSTKNKQTKKQKHFCLLQEREIERQRDTERHRDRRICFRTLASCQSYRVTYPDDIDRQTQTDGYRQIGRQTQTDRQTKRQAHQTDRQAGRQAGRLTQTGRQTDTNRQAGEQTDRQAGRQTNKETERGCGSYTGLVLHSSPGLQQFPRALHVTNGRRHAQWGQSQLATHSRHP